LHEGVSLEQIIDADRRGSLYRAGLDALLWPEGGGLTVAELAAEAGMSEEAVRRARRLVGLTDPGDEPVCHRGEIAPPRVAYGHRAVRRRASAAVHSRPRPLDRNDDESRGSMFAVSVAEPMRDAGASPVEYAQSVREATRTFTTARTPST
jgi:hypothetical protein